MKHLLLINKAIIIKTAYLNYLIKDQNPSIIYQKEENWVEEPERSVEIPNPDNPLDLSDEFPAGLSRPKTSGPGDRQGCLLIIFLLMWDFARNPIAICKGNFELYKSWE